MHDGDVPAAPITINTGPSIKKATEGVGVCRLVCQRAGMRYAAVCWRNAVGRWGTKKIPACGSRAVGEVGGTRAAAF